MKEPSLAPPAPAPARRRFVTTRWSLVLAAGQDAAPQARKALSELCEFYWSPLYDFVRRQGHSEEEAKDLTQGFFTQLLGRNDLAVADPGRGRFRAWLLASIKHYLANEKDRQQALKRGGERAQVDLKEAEHQESQQPEAGLTPERAFERRWAERLLENVLAALGEEYKSRGRGLLFEKLKQTLTGEGNDSYARLAEELGKTVGAVKVEIFRLRRRYQALLRAEVAHTVAAPEDVDEELRFLISTFEST